MLCATYPSPQLSCGYTLTSRSSRRSLGRKTGSPHLAFIFFDEKNLTLLLRIVLHFYLQSKITQNLKGAHTHTHARARLWTHLLSPSSAAYFRTLYLYTHTLYSFRFSVADADSTRFTFDSQVLSYPL